MEGKLYKSPNGEHYYLTVDGQIFAEIGGHPLKSINQALSLKNCEAIANGYDLDELSWKFFPYHEWEYSNGSFGDINEENRETFKIGFQKALEILGDKKFSESNLRIGCSSLLNLEKEEGELSEVFTEKQYRHIDNYIQSLQQTEWDVEIVYEKDCYSSAGRCDKLIMADCIICTPVTYLRDENGCLILTKKKS